MIEVPRSSIRILYQPYEYIDAKEKRYCVETDTLLINTFHKVSSTSESSEIPCPNLLALTTLTSMLEFDAAMC